MSLNTTIWKLVLGTKLDAAEFGGGAEDEAPPDAGGTEPDLAYEPDLADMGGAEPDPAEVGGTEPDPPVIGARDSSTDEFSTLIGIEPDEGGGGGEGAREGGAGAAVFLGIVSIVSAYVCEEVKR